MRRFPRLFHLATPLSVLIGVSIAAAQSPLQFIPGTIITVTGNGTAGAAAGEVSTPRGVAVDSSGNLYVADTSNNRVLKVTPAGVVTTYAGNRTAGFAGDGGQAASAELHGPEDIALDAVGNLYIADSTNNRIRKVTPVGIISTYAGSSLTVGYGGDGGAATSALLNTPWGVALDASGNLYIADQLNNCIRIVDPVAQNINSFAGVCSTATGTFGGDGASALAAHLKAPHGVVVDSSGNVYIADTSNNRIRMVKGGIISTVWGNGNATYTTDGQPGTSSPISSPEGVAVDAAGTLYATNVNDFRVGRLSDGIVTTILGTGTTGYNGDGIPATTAQIATVVKVAVDSVGNIYVGDSNNRVREVLAAQATMKFGNQAVGTTSTAQTVTLFNTGALPVTITSITDSVGYSAATTGTGNCASGLSVLSGASCTVPVTFSPAALGASTGAITITDAAGSHVINLTGIGTLAPSTVALSFSPNPIDLSANTTATVTVTAPTGITTVPSGTVTFATNGTPIGTTAMLNTSGVATTTFGSTLLPGSYPVIASYSGDTNFLPGANSPAVTLIVNGVATTTSLSISPAAPQIGQGETLTATVTHAAGSTAPTGSVSFYDGSTLLDALSINTSGQAVDPVTLTYGTHSITVVYSGDALYNPSSSSAQIITVGPGPIASVNPAIVNTIAGGLTTGYGGDGGAATAATLDDPYDVAVDRQNNVYIADCTNNRVRRISGGIITTFAGTGAAGFAGDGGLATKAVLHCPRALAVDGYGNVYLSDYTNSVIRKIDTAGIIATIAGTAGTSGYSGDGGQATNAKLTTPWGLAVDKTGNVYIADEGNYVVRKVDPTGVITTMAGTHVMGTTTGTNGDGGPATAATFIEPARLALDTTGNLYVSDFSANRIRKIDTSGKISTYAGTGTAAFGGDGAAASAASLNGPWGIATDAAGDLYIADKTNGAIRFVNTAGIISTIAGNGIAGYTGNGGPATSAEFLAPWGIALDSTGNVYIADTTSKDTESAVRELFVSTGAINFGTLTLGGQQALPVLGSLTNTGAAALSISSITVTGTGFALLAGTPNGCTSTTTLAPSSSCAFSVGFTYGALGNSTGTLVITDNSGNGVNSTQTVALSAVTSLPTVNLTLNISPATFAAPGDNITFSATVAATSTNPGPPSGTVTFLANGNTIGSVAVTNGVATFSTTTLPLGTYTVTAQYSGDANYQPAVSAAQAYTVSYDFALSVTPPTANIPLGQNVTGTITLTPSKGFVTPVLLSCSNLPASYSCVFGTTTLTPDGSGTALNTSILLQYTAPNAQLRPWRDVIFAGMFFITCFGFRRKKIARVALIMSAMIPLLLSGCGGGAGPQSHENPATYPVVVTATAGVIIHAANISVHLQ